LSRVALFWCCVLSCDFRVISCDFVMLAHDVG